MGKQGISFDKFRQKSRRMVRQDSTRLDKTRQRCQRSEGSGSPALAAGPPIEVGGSAAVRRATSNVQSKRGAVRRATIEFETTAGVFRQRSIKVQSKRGAILRMLQKKDGNSMAAKQFLWLQTNPLAWYEILLYTTLPLLDTTLPLVDRNGTSIFSKWNRLII